MTMFAGVLKRAWEWLGGLGASWLDVKLGLRMLLRHPGLTIVAVFALSIGIPAGLIPIHILDAMSRQPRSAVPGSSVPSHSVPPTVA